MDETPYASFRINITGGSFPITLEEVKNFCSVYEHCLMCFEPKDATVKNNHVHVIVWGEAIEESEWRQRLHSEIKYISSSKNRFAWCDPDLKGRNFTRACQYLCKGSRDCVADIPLNTDFTQPEIDAFWLAYWGEQTRIVKNNQEDTSTRMIPKLYQRHGLEVIRKMNESDVPGRCARYCLFKLWYDICMHEWYVEEKPYDRNKFMAVVMGLILRTDEESFNRNELEKCAKIAGFGNLHVNHGEQAMETFDLNTTFEE